MPSSCASKSMGSNQNLSCNDLLPPSSEVFFVSQDFPHYLFLRFDTPPPQRYPNHRRSRGVIYRAYAQR